MRFDFDAMELHRDHSVASARYEIESREDGWEIRRDGESQLVLGAGYVALETIACGVCATDLARPYLPFPMPQIVGHEVLALNSHGERVVIDINASCLARDLDELCGACRNGLPTHCQERLTLGINGLPGGFGPRVLAPVAGLFTVPDEIPDETAVLMEPFAAALHAVDSLDLKDGEVVFVLGPRRLGMLIVAAFAARRRERGGSFKIDALVRREELGSLAVDLGADRFVLSQSDDIQRSAVVVECSGNPEALGLAINLAQRELHLKSTHGQGAVGLNQLTALVVDEFSIEQAGNESVPKLADVKTETEPNSDLAAVVVESDDEVDQAIRPIDGSEVSWLCPRGRILIGSQGHFESPLLRAVQERGLRVSSSRCGDFEVALSLLSNDRQLQDIGARLLTHTFKQKDLAAAFSQARSRDSIKVLVKP